jgi:hypothetical protein
MIRYTSIDDFARHLLPWMQPVFHRVRMLLLTFPEVSEKLRYNNTPFYDCGGRRMVYLSSFEKHRLILGFCNGYLMEDPAGVLKNEKHQTIIRHWEFKEKEVINETLLITYIEAAIRLNLSFQQHATNRKTRKRS